MVAIFSLKLEVENIINILRGHTSPAAIPPLVYQYYINLQEPNRILSNKYTSTQGNNSEAYWTVLASFFVLVLGCTNLVMYCYITMQPQKKVS